MWVEKTFHQRNAENMRQLMDLILGPNPKPLIKTEPRETYTTRESLEDDVEFGHEQTDDTGDLESLPEPEHEGEEYDREASAHCEDREDTELLSE